MEPWMCDLLQELLVGALIGVVSVVLLQWSCVDAWVKRYSRHYDDVGVLMRNCLASDRYEVRAGIFSREGELSEAILWHCQDMEEKLQILFLSSDQIELNLGQR